MGGAMKTDTDKSEAKEQFAQMGEALKGLVHELQMQAHLGAMELKANAGPYLDEVMDAARATTADLVKRGRQLQRQLETIRAAHEKARRP
jgi:hypothetical protein